MPIETKQRKPSISSYYKTLRIKDCKSKRSYWKHVRGVDSVLAEELEPLLCREKQGNFYDVKNASLPFSLAVESWTMSYHKSILSWINQQKKLKPKRILEIGCDNGVLACWYATRFPDAEIIGIDQSENGIQCANELAKQLGLANVSFYRIEFLDLRERFLMNSIDLIISVRTFHEIMGPIFFPKYWSLQDYLKKNPTYRNWRYLQIVDDLLTEDGTYLSFERLENPADLGKWANSLNQVNLHVQWDKCDIIDYNEFGTDKCSPIVVVSKSETGLATQEGIECFYTKDHSIVLEAGESYSGAKAEIAYHRLGKKTFQSGYYLDVPNHWHVFRFEIWETKSFLLVYSYGNMGYRHLDILPAGAYEDAQSLIEEVMRQFSHLGPMVQYNNLEDNKYIMLTD
ncbi:methyltransferase domain-containing protein [Paenibacillus sp. BSR1-1]|uniref:methyltransferase domain-containing protein n=1 Tax=Paenibacillus sp. BSR1-1 TaxID=3020845 RepID=UPI0025B204C4|nr:methyltransferase domain-containing protein [Paenibacillus sp. BSR1-1]MDN3016144.1 methyltransferase domain-containing protein [Paenibacillus sp. BSR1-1]